MLQATASRCTLQGGRQTGRGRVERDLSQLSNAYDQSKKEKKCLAVSPTPLPLPSPWLLSLLLSGKPVFFRPAAIV